MTANLNIIPADYSGTLELLAQSFGGEDELKRVLDDQALREILSFEGFVAVVKPWACHIELAHYGFAGGSYRVFDRNWKFQHEVWPNEDWCFGSFEDVEMLWKAKNGAYFRVLFETTQDVRGGIVICQNQLPSAVERYWIDVWQKAAEITLWRPQEHEFLFTNLDIPKLGYLRIHYLAGRATEPKKLEDFYYFDGGVERGLKEPIQILDIPAELITNWYPKQSGWYLIRHQYAFINRYHYCAVVGTEVDPYNCRPEEFPNSRKVIRKTVYCKDLSCSQELQIERAGEHIVQNIPVKMNNLTGVGMRRVRYYEDGIFYLDLSGSNLSPSLPHSQLFGVGSPQHAYDTSNWTRLEATLCYDIRGVSVDQDQVGAEVGRKLIDLSDWDEVKGFINPKGVLVDSEQATGYLLRSLNSDSDSSVASVLSGFLSDQEQTQASILVTITLEDQEQVEINITVTSEIEDTDEATG